MQAQQPERSNLLAAMCEVATMRRNRKPEHHNHPTGIDKDEGHSSRSFGLLSDDGDDYDRDVREPGSLFDSRRRRPRRRLRRRRS